MKKLTTVILLLTVLLVGIANAEGKESRASKSEMPGYAWIGASYPCLSASNVCTAANTFSVGQEIDLVVGFFAPDTDNWEVDWVLTDSNGSMVHIIRRFCSQLRVMWWRKPRSHYHLGLIPTVLL
ncbi:MAG TPA: hypothetical protein DCP92_10310 [Nitrospiraceae bacterium]|jgi:hypothetical protein|nr:hypothetical protein [Nitrospiraceae bacterium]